jgi:hypothetical protein
MKQKRSMILIVLGIISLVLIVGCGRGGEVSGGAPTTPFLGGSQGLEMKFLQGNPPDEITDGDGTTSTFPFKVIVTLRNMGEFDLKKDQVKISLIGFLPEDFGVVDTVLKDQNPEDDPSPRLRDSEGNIIESVEVYKTFPKADEDLKFKRQLHGNTPFIFKANVCYKYQTKAASEICFLENLVDVADDAICDPSEPKNIFSSGSPLGVPAFRQTVVGKDKIQFSFDIVHSGSGDVFDPTVDANCPKDATNKRNNEDKVKVTVKTALTDDKLDCVGLTDTATDSSGIIKLVNGKRTITCTQELDSGRPDFRKTVDITLDFNYLDSADREVLVKHVIS